MMKLLIRATVASCLIGQIAVAEGRSGSMMGLGTLSS
jgi:hypothetical protein